MKSMTTISRNVRLALAAALLAGGSGFVASLQQGVAYAQSANSIYLTPGSGGHKVGDSFTVEVHVNTSDQINTVEAHLTYDSSLQFVSIDDNGSAFGVAAEKTGGSGQVNLAMGTTSAVSGDQLVAKVNFKAIAAGAGAVSMLDTSQALSSTTYTNVITTRTGGAYNITGASPSTGGGSTTTTSTPAPSTSTTSTPSGTTSTTTKAAASQAKVSIASQGGSSATPLPGDSVVQLQAPATVETTTDSGREVSKVEYLLNGKLVTTDATPPYTHTVDTTKLRNGKYTLTTKTYYKDGKVDTSTASLIVDNPFGAEQMWLQVKHYAWLIVLLLVAAGVLLYLKLFRGRGNTSFGNGGAGTPGGSGPGTIVVGGNSTPGAPIAPPLA